MRFSLVCPALNTLNISVVDSSIGYFVVLYETGRVVAVDGDGLWLETLKKSTCGQCSARAGCGQQLLAKSALTNMTFIKAFFPKSGPDVSGTHSAEYPSHSKIESNQHIDAKGFATKNPEHEKAADSLSGVSLSDWQIGDIAEISLDENALVKATMIAYLLPLASMVVSTILAAQVFTSDYLVAVSALVGLIFGGVLVHSHARGYFSIFRRVLPFASLSSSQAKASNHYKESCYHALVVRKV